MEFVCFASLDELPASADALFAEGAKRSIFLSRPWFDNLTAHAEKNGEKSRFACVVDQGEVRAILPLAESGDGNWRSLHHRYTSFFSLLLAAEDRRRTVACLTEGLFALPCTGLLLEPIGDDDAAITDLQRAFEAAGCHCERNFRFYNWILRLDGQSFDDYLASRPSRLRNTIRRKQRKLQREHALEIRLHIGDEAPRAMADYHAVYRASWKANEQYKNFLDGMVERFSSVGATRLGVLHADGQPVAAQLWFVMHGKASIFRLAYDEQWRPYSPGSILTSHLMRHVIDIDGVSEVDFLTGNEAYKQEWMSLRRERWALGCACPALRTSRLARLAGTIRRRLGS